MIDHERKIMMIMMMTLMMAMGMAIKKFHVGTSFQGTKISHLGKFGKSSTHKCRLVGDMIMMMTLMMAMGTAINMFHLGISNISHQPPNIQTSGHRT